MKTLSFKRFGVLFLALCLLGSMLSVGVSAEDLSWTYKDLLQLEQGVDIVGIYPQEEDLQVAIPGAFQVDEELSSSEHLFLVNNFPVPEITLVEGHQLRSIMRTYMPEGNVGNICHRSYYGGSNKFLDDYASEFSEVKVDETYGYSYVESYVNVTVTAAQAGTHTDLGLWIANPGNPNYSTAPFQFFSWDLVDVTDGNKLLFSYTGQDFIDAGVVEYHSPAMCNPAYNDVKIGVTAIDGGPYMCFDIYSYPGQGANPVQPGDHLQLAVKMWKPEGWMDMQPFTASVDYYPNAISDPEDQHKEPLFQVSITNEAEYDEWETQFDETYGYEYKLVLADHLVSEEEAEKINLKRINPLIGTGYNFYDSPVSLYGIEIYNVTQDCYYLQLDGGSVLGGGTQTVNEFISIREYDPAYAIAGQVKSNKNVAFEEATAPAGEEGLYQADFTVKGDAGKRYVAKAYLLDSEGQTVQTGQAAFVATGEEQTVEMSFNLRQEEAASTLCFGVQTADGALNIQEITFRGRMGDCVEEDEFELQQIANEVIDQIEALPEKITPAEEEAIVAARAAVEALSEEVRALVNNLEKLTAAEAALVQAKEDALRASEVEELIAALPQEPTEGDEVAVKAARAAYEALTEAQKALVSAETLEKLVALEEKFQEPEIAYGDVDGNGKVDAADALKALQHAVKLTTLEGDVATAADVNGDDKIDATDALLMLQYTVKLIDSFPVESK